MHKKDKTLKILKSRFSGKFRDLNKLSTFLHSFIHSSITKVLLQSKQKFMMENGVSKMIRSKLLMKKYTKILADISLQQNFHIIKKLKSVTPGK